MKLPALLLAFFSYFISNAQSHPFVPLNHEYPEKVLATPKTYVYKNAATGKLSFKDIVLEKKAGDVIVSWKSYDDTPVIDSCIEINDKGLDHYLIINGQKIKTVVTEDSLYNDGSKLGKKVQALHFNLNPSIGFSAIIHSRFLKDTIITWQGKPIPCLVIESYSKQTITNSQYPNQEKEIKGKVLYYFGKDIGLIQYTSETDGEAVLWELKEIKEVEKQTEN